MKSLVIFQLQKRYKGLNETFNLIKAKIMNKINVILMIFIIVEIQLELTQVTQK